MAKIDDMPSRTELNARPRAPVGAPRDHARELLLQRLPLEERHRQLAGIPSAVLEGGAGPSSEPPLILLHGPGGHAAHWLRVIPGLATRHRLIVPDLPGHGRTEPGNVELDAELVIAWLDDLIKQTCATSPVLVGELLGGAIAMGFVSRHPGSVSQLVLVDSLGLAALQPAPELARAVHEFGAQPDSRSHEQLWQTCAHDLRRLRQDMGELWEPFESCNVEGARREETKAARQRLMAEFGLAALPARELGQIRVPTTLIWGRHDLATPLAVAERASASYGWPLHVIEGANDAPQIEQPEAFLSVLEAALAARAGGGVAPSRAARRRHDTAREDVDTLVIGGGQAGLATSYWLTRAGLEHVVLERRQELGGSWPDRWDSFHLVSPNFCLLLPGMPYRGPDPDAFMPRDQVIEYVRAYAAHIEAPVRLGHGVERLSAEGERFVARTAAMTFSARQVVLATGAYQRPKVPAIASALPSHIQQLHSSEYRRPAQLAAGAVLVVGTGQSGAQIAEELRRAGRDVHVAVSMCPGAPRRYRGRDIIWWLFQTFQNGAKYGVRFPTVDDLPTPAARFACNPHLSGADGGHDIHLRQLAREGMHLYGRLEDIEGSLVRFSDDLPQRLAFADSKFNEELRPLFDAYITAAGIDAPPDDRPPPDDFTPPTITELDLDRAGVTTVLWATGYRLDFGWIDLPVLDEWGYPKHMRGATECPGLYVVGLPWLYSEPSSVFAGVGADAAYVVEHLAEHRAARVRRSGAEAPQGDVDLK